MSDEREPTVRIGMREIYDVLLELKAQVANSSVSTESLARDLTRHEEVITELETKVTEQSERFARWRYMLTSGALTGALSLATVLTRLIMK